MHFLLPLFVTLYYIMFSRCAYSFQLRNLRMVSSSPKSKSAFRFESEDIRVLLGEVAEVIRTTGVRPGVVRTIQASGVFSKLLREYASSPALFQTKNGNISPPIVLRKLFEGLGATYVKLGQFIASSPTLFPKEYVMEFQSCLDNTPTIPYSKIRSIIQEDLSKPISSMFAYIDPVPVASASIAQVHKGKLLDGTEVAIKVRKPGVKEVLRADLGFIFVASKLIEFINPSLTKVSLSDIIGDLRASMLNELDFKKEANNLDSFREFLLSRGILDATAPKPFRQFSSTRVLTMEYFKGVPLADLEGISQYTSNPEATLITALRTWAASAAEHKFFHADVHAGNLMVLEDGRVGFIDFGIVGKLSDKVVNAMEDAVNCFANDDFRGLASALCRMGATDADVDIDAFGRDLRSMIERISSIQPEVVIRSTIDGSAVAAQMTVDERETAQLAVDIVQVAEDNGIRLPREFGLLVKQSLYFDRYLKLLAPTLDPLTDSRIRGPDYIPGQSGYNSGSSGPSTSGGTVIDVDAISIK
mmetsp:Transcript_32971/g.33578  ORF Transcript_32971/g.33578 Transcript_32971/m.33578 type:complete len:530 (-) Transcript_32971:241-1830(-)